LELDKISSLPKHSYDTCMKQFIKISTGQELLFTRFTSANLNLSDRASV